MGVVGIDVGIDIGVDVGVDVGVAVGGVVVVGVVTILPVLLRGNLTAVHFGCVDASHVNKPRRGGREINELTSGK